MFLCWSTVLPVLPSILHIPSIGELLRGDCPVQEGVTYGTIPTVDAHGLGCPWTFHRDLEINLILHRKFEPQLPKGF